MSSRCDDGSEGRPQGACVLCPPPRESRPWRLADPGYVTCSRCLDRLRERLDDIADRYLRLDPSPQHGGDGGRDAPGFGSRSPASDHIIAMRDPRSSPDAYVWLGSDGRLHRESERPPLSVFSVLDTIAWEIAEARELSEGPSGLGVPDLVRWIDNHLDWLTRQPQVVEAAEALRRVQSQLKPVTGDPLIKVGVCPNTIDEGERTRPCRAPLFAPSDSSPDDTIRCPACHRAWSRSEWLKLGELLDAS